MKILHGIDVLFKLKSRGSLMCFLIKTRPLLLILFVFSSSALAKANTDSYFPFVLHDNFKAVLHIQITSEIQGSLTVIDSFDSYVWVDGTKYISGVKCYRVFHSQKGYYQRASEEAISVIAYQALVNNEYRNYGLDDVLSDGTLASTRYDSYQLQWKYGQEIGDQFSHTYETQMEGCEVYRTTTTRNILLTEYISTPFGNFENALKYKENSSVIGVCNGYSNTFEHSIDVWTSVKDNKWLYTYKSYNDSFISTYYQVTEIESLPPVDTDNDSDGENDPNRKQVKVLLFIPILLFGD